VSLKKFLFRQYGTTTQRKAPINCLEILLLAYLLTYARSDDRWTNHTAMYVPDSWAPPTTPRGPDQGSVWSDAFRVGCRHTNQRTIDHRRQCRRFGLWPQSTKTAFMARLLSLVLTFRTMP